MTEKERTERFAKAAPSMSEAELERINALFPAFIFRRSRTRELWTACCRRHVTLPDQIGQSREERRVMAEPHQREPKNYWEDKRPMVPCPYCGREAVVKEVGRTGTRKNLSAYRRAIIFRWWMGALWANAYECEKHYTGSYQLTGTPDCKLTGIYRFRPGLAEGCSRPWRGGNCAFSNIARQDTPLEKGKWHVHDPFSCNAEYGAGYDVIGLQEVQKSPFRYCMVEQWEKGHSDVVEFLEACCFYPRQIEMLMKAGMVETVKDLVSRGVKNAMAMDWNKGKPEEAFGLSKQELREFLQTNRDIRNLELYKRLERKVPVTKAADWIKRGADIRRTMRAAKEWGLPPEKLFRYLEKGQPHHHMGSNLRTWEDYLTAARETGYPLHRENVLLPRDLGAAHEEATKKHRAKLAEEAKKQAEEQKRLRAMKYEDRKQELEKKYGYYADGYVIRAPASEAEIVREGQLLKHCVGGYAHRHMDGRVTILFMRREKQPDKPFLTIEMDGARLVQIHGYKNEGLYTTKGRFAPDPREVYREFLDTWLDWLKKGSRRDPEGRPKLPEKKKTEVKIA